MPPSKRNIIPDYDGPEYARSVHKQGERARTIIAEGSLRAEKCTQCMRNGVDCYTHPTRYKKCAFCTARDYDIPMCHLKGQPSPGPRKKRRRVNDEDRTKVPESPYTVDSNDATATALPQEPLWGPSPTSLPRLNALPLRVADLRRKSAEMELATVRLEKAESKIEKLERQNAVLTYALEEVLRRVNAIESVDSKGPSAPRPSLSHVLPIANLMLEAHAEAKSMDVEEGGKLAEPVVDRTEGIMQWEAGKKSPRHTISHPLGFRPVNCSCALSVSQADPLPEV